MSWTRRILVLLAFALMVGGVALMITQREELYLAASMAGFVLMLAAVPSLPRQRAGAAEAVPHRQAGAPEPSAAGPGLDSPGRIRSRLGSESTRAGCRRSRRA